MAGRLREGCILTDTRGSFDRTAVLLWHSYSRLYLASNYGSAVALHRLTGCDVGH